MASASPEIVKARWTLTHPQINTATGVPQARKGKPKAECYIMRTEGAVLLSQRGSAPSSAGTCWFYTAGKLIPRSLS